MRKKLFLKKTMSLALVAAMALTVSPTTTFAATNVVTEVSTYAAENNETYKYVYAGLTWSEYWKSEGVYEAENVQSSDKLDSRKEFDKGGFDAVTRATTNHGIHRGSFQCNTTIYDKDGNTYDVLYWKNDDKGKGTSECVLTDGRVINFVKGTITYTDKDGNEKTATMDDYVVTGIKYVPVAVKTDDYEAFKEKYITVENGEKLAGGYSENKLKSYDETANVTENTNGLKVATKNKDGSFTFGERKTGTDSGVLDTALVKDEGVTVNVLESDDIGAYGEFMRVDLKGNYGDLGSRMQAVRWTYYGNDALYKTPVISYGTKFAADNWMHKVNGIQLGLTDSIRCQIPKGYDGTGYWKVTVYALGHEDCEFTFNATAANVKLSEDDATVDTTELSKLVAEASKLNEKDYTAASWKVFKEEFNEAKEELANPKSQANVNEAIAHLTAAMNSLEKVKTNTNTNNTTNNNNANNNKGNSNTSTTVTLDKGTVFESGSIAYVITKFDSEVEVKAVKNKNAKTVNIPATVTKNGKAYKVTSIGKNAIRNCKKLNKVTIGKNVAKIGANAFTGNKNLKTIIVKSTNIKSVGAKAFKGISKKAKIKVPKSKLKAYKKLFNKKGQSKSVKISK